jgi:peptidoglycan/xylan/chitin deacetylase (PgdA/CDA1 family)
MAFGGGSVTLPGDVPGPTFRALQELVSFIVRWGGIALLTRRTIARSKISILVYHDPDPVTLERHLSYLSRGYRFVTLDRLVTALHTEDWGEIPQRGVVITLDDGHRGNARLGDLFQRFSVTPTIYVCSQIVGTNRHYWFLDADEGESLMNLSSQARASRLQEMGFTRTKEFPAAERQALTRGELEALAEVSEIGSHGRFHALLTTCSEEEASDEIILSKQEVEALSGGSCRHFCFPNGDYGAFERQVVEEAGYASARTTDFGWNGRDADPYSLKAFVVPDDASVNRIATTLSGFSTPLGKLARSVAAVLRRVRPKPDDGDLAVVKPAHELSTHRRRGPAGKPGSRPRSTRPRERSSLETTKEPEPTSSSVAGPPERSEMPNREAD